MMEKGSRVRMTGLMSDPDPIPVGSEGTVTFVSQTPWGIQVGVKWDNGRSLMLVQEDLPMFTVVA